jgi:hypothetical protein
MNSYAALDSYPIDSLLRTPFFQPFFQKRNQILFHHPAGGFKLFQRFSRETSVIGWLSMSSRLEWMEIIEQMVFRVDNQDGEDHDTDSQSDSDLCSG